MIFSNLSDKKKFVLKYSLRALLSLLIIFGGLLLFKELYFDHDPDYWLEKFYSNSLVVHLIYVASEILFGLFPPEIFMFWATKAGDTSSYVINIIFYASVSMGAGHLAYWGGRYFAKVLGKRVKKRLFMQQYIPIVKKFGGLLIVIAAITPLPWATISLVMGALEYQYRKFTYYSLARILRFAVNGFLIFQSGTLFF